MVKLLKKISFCLLLLGSVSSALGQDCGDIDFEPSTSTRSINWEAFEGIDLPFTLVYGGPTFNRSAAAPLDFGFTHVSETNVFSQISPSQRAQIYYGTGYVNQNQPWENYRSPWGNDLELYQQKWRNDYTTFSRGEGRINADIMVFDIERQWRTDFDILQLKSNPNISETYRNLSNEDFLKTYKKDLRALYAASLESFVSNGGYATGTKVSSYSDAPVWNVFDNIQGATWEEWQSDPSLVNYLLQNDTGNIGGAFDRQLTFLTPSAYYYYDYPHPFAGEYLSYLLFQIEVNKAWSNKPVVPFVWMRYSFTPQFQNQFIKPWMAEATAIFPFFSGADGMWLWENPQNFQNDENFATYEYYLKGLRRLTEFRDMFEGSYELVIETSARDYNELKTPIWRGVVKNNELLVAAHNPYANDENDESTVLVTYGNFSRVVKLTGYEVFLCKFDLTVLSIDELIPSIKVFPNPVSNHLQIEVPKGLSNPSVIMYNTLGENLGEWQLGSGSTFNIPIQGIHEKVFYLNLVGPDYNKTFKMVNGRNDP